MAAASDVLEKTYKLVKDDLNRLLIADEIIRSKVEFVCRCLSNRAAVRLLMSCMLAKIDRPNVDPREPYTEIGSPTCFSGRKYDEQFIAQFITAHTLPCNSTTAFLTPSLRNISRPLTTDVTIIGRPAKVYVDTLEILEDVAEGRASAEAVLGEVIRVLTIVREEKNSRIATLLAGIEQGKDALPLSAEATVILVQQHLNCKNSSRLPVLVVAAAYSAVSDRIDEFAMPLRAHNAADEQTGASGDLEICLVGDSEVVTCYEMKMKRVTKEDVDRAITKITDGSPPIEHYVFITTDLIEDEVSEYASGFYEKLAGSEIVILDCIGFLRHFLHFFHRHRVDFLEAYQELVLAEPDSAVRQPLKEAFLSLRQSAESDE